jgi:hypothetical protein
MDSTATMREFACQTTVGRRAARTGTILAGMYDSACPTDGEQGGARIGRSPPTITCRHLCRSWFGKFSPVPIGELNSESVIGVPEHAAFVHGSAQHELVRESVRPCAGISRWSGTNYIRHGTLDDADEDAAAN